MKKDEREGVSIDLEINIDAIRAAASNSTSMRDITIEVPVVDPKTLCCDEQIFGIVLQPINKKEQNKLGPATGMYCAVNPVIIDVLNSRAKPGFIQVNGTIDLPKEAGRINSLTQCYFTSNKVAKAVCRVITEVEADRSLARQAQEKLTSDFLLGQLNDDNF
jgi:hypothetical protein